MFGEDYFDPSHSYISFGGEDPCIGRVNSFVLVCGSLCVSTMFLLSWFPSWSGEKDEPTEEGSDDGNLPPDPSDLDEREIDKKIFKLERQLDRISDDIDKRKQQYTEYLQKGANSPPGRRRVFAIRARLEKFKAQIQEIERLQAIKELSMWVALKGQRDLQTMMSDLDASPDPTEMIDLDMAEFQQKMDELQHDIEFGMEEVTNIMSQTDVNMNDVSVSLSEEQELMNRMAEGEVTSDELGLELDLLDEESTELGSVDQVTDSQSVEELLDFEETFGDSTNAENSGDQHETDGDDTVENSRGNNREKNND